MSDGDEIVGMVYAPDGDEVCSLTMVELERIRRELGSVSTPTVWVTEGNWARLEGTLAAEGVRNASGPVNRDIFGGVPVRELGKGSLPRAGDLVFDGQGFHVVAVDPPGALRRLLPGSVA